MSVRDVNTDFFLVSSSVSALEPIAIAASGYTSVQQTVLCTVFQNARLSKPFSERHNGLFHLISTTGLCRGWTTNCCTALPIYSLFFLFGMDVSHL